MVSGPTTLSQLTQEEFGQLVDSDIYPAGPCPACRKNRAMKVWGSDGWRWSARCGECEEVVPAEYVTFVDARQLHILIEHDGNPQDDPEPLSKPN